jgi:hypothetical protein
MHARTMPRRWPTAAGVTAYAAFVVLRVWQFHGRGVGVWPDTTGYQETARAGWLSSELWAGRRAPGLPIVLKLTGQHLHTAIDLQFVGSVLAWMAVAWVVGRSLRAGWPRWLGSGLVLGFALTGPVTLWDRQVLTESWSLTLLATTFAASFWFAQRRTWPRALVLVASALAWTAFRDGHAVTIGLAGLVVVVGVAIAGLRRRPVDRRVAAVGVALLLVAIAARAGSEQGDRNLLPISNVYAVRVLPFPDRFDWFADHGMPQRDRLEALVRSAHIADEPGALVVPAVANRGRDPLLAAYYRWLRDHGESTLLRYAVTHPGYVFTEPFERPERGFNSFGGWSGYVPHHREVPLVDRVLFPPWPVALVLFVVACSITIRRRLHSWDWWLAFGWAGLGVVALAAAWHADGQELSRHVLVPDVQIRLAVFVALALAVNSLVSPSPSAPPTSPRPGAARRRRDGPSTGPEADPEPGTSPPTAPADIAAAGATGLDRGSPGTP